MVKLPNTFSTSISVASRPSSKLLPKSNWTLIGDALLQKTWLDANLPEPTGAIWVNMVEQTKHLKFIVPWLESWANIPLVRNSTVVAVGGGTLTDMAGLGAALYMRGIDWHSWPTTMLAQIDAGVGGKTGVDLKAGRNLVGAFHAPKKLIICHSFLKTLPIRQLQSGYWELLKIALLYGDQKWANAIITSNGIPDQNILTKALHAKLQIVNRDPIETNERRLLNLGHTIGHSIEINSRYQLLHGEAVGFGLLAACYLSEKLSYPKFPSGFIEQIISKLAPLAHLLPPWKVCLNQLYLDKKCVTDCNNASQKLIYCILPCFCQMAQQRLLPPDIWQSAYERLIGSFN